MRVFYALTTTVLLLSLAPSGNSQIQIKTEEHSCEGQFGWETPACQSAWQANVSAVFLGFATNVREEDVPIIRRGSDDFVGIAARANHVRLRFHAGAAIDVCDDVVIFVGMLF